MVEPEELIRRLTGMDYCLGAGDGTASMWSAAPDVDTDGDGVLDGVTLDFDRDGLRAKPVMAILCQYGRQFAKVVVE